MIEGIYNWVSGNALQKAWVMGIELFIKRSQSKYETPKAYADMSKYVESAPVLDQYGIGWESLEPQIDDWPESHENMWQCSNCETLNQPSGNRIVRTCGGCGKSWREVASFVPGSPMRILRDNAIRAATSSTYQAVGYYNS